MDRRTFIGTVTGGLLAAPLAVEAQQAGKVPRIGILTLNRATAPRILEVFLQGLRDLGYVEGRNVGIEYQDANGNLERLPALSAELVRLNVDIIVTFTGTVAIAAGKATQTIPIVMAASGDAVRQGLVASLAHPGGNITGLTTISPDLSQKRLEIFRDAVPKLSRVGVLWCGGSGPTSVREWAETRAAARTLRIQLVSLEVLGCGVSQPKCADGISTAFLLAERQRAQAILGFDCPPLVPSAARIADLSIKHGLPGMYPVSLYSIAGGLMSYGPDLADLARRAAIYVDKILRGAKAADLPVEQPTKFELVINLKTAKALGLTIPPSLLQRADQVIE
jgi:putative ABC transport system substrate-binding protein